MCLPPFKIRGVYTHGRKHFTRFGIQIIKQGPVDITRVKDPGKDLLSFLINLVRLSLLIIQSQINNL